MSVFHKVEIILFERDLQAIGNLSHTRPLNGNFSGHPEDYSLTEETRQFFSLCNQWSLDSSMEDPAFLEDFKIICCPGRKYDFPFLDSSCVLRALLNRWLAGDLQRLLICGSRAMVQHGGKHAKLQLVKLSASTFPVLSRKRD